jgi:hypothetical protein
VILYKSIKKNQAINRIIMAKNDNIAAAVVARYQAPFVVQLAADWAAKGLTSESFIIRDRVNGLNFLDDHVFLKHNSCIGMAMNNTKSARNNSNSLTVKSVDGAKCLRPIGLIDGGKIQSSSGTWSWYSKVNSEHLKWGDVCLAKAFKIITERKINSNMILETTVFTSHSMEELKGMCYVALKSENTLGFDHLPLHLVPLSNCSDADHLWETIQKEGGANPMHVSPDGIVVMTLTKITFSKGDDFIVVDPDSSVPASNINCGKLKPTCRIQMMVLFCDDVKNPM